jgi:hypothetical protein
MRSFIHNTRGREGRGEEMHARALEWGLGWVTSRSIIHINLHKLNNKLVNA